MINDNMSIEDIILDIGTRATNLFATGNNNISVAFGGYEKFPNFWQVWLDHWIDGWYWFDERLTYSLWEGTTLRYALMRLDNWLSVQENKPNKAHREEIKIQESLIIEGQEITESIGFGD